MARILGAGQTTYVRRPDETVTTKDVLARAAELALEDAGLTPGDVDGLGVASFSLTPDRAIDLGVHLGLRLRWLMDGGTGGASAVDMLQHARRAIESGDARCIVLVAGDVLRPAGQLALTNAYNATRQAYLAPIPHGGANSLFALLTTMHMKRNDLTREDYGAIVVAQREWAGKNPNALYRDSLTIDEYLGGAVVADPLVVYDCVPVVAGGDAIVVGDADEGLGIRTLAISYNWDNQEGNGMETGLRALAEPFWRAAGVAPADVDVVSVYDDYPVMVLIQLVDLGFGSVREILQAVRTRRLALNTSGGQLAAGQTGAGGGMHGVVEVVRQLQRAAGERQVPDARVGLATGYGMVAYRYGACVNAVLLEGA
jgi:acetyl-CoA acetyltransferase